MAARRKFRAHWATTASEVICHPVALQEVEGVSRALGFLDVHATHARARQHGLSARLELGHCRLRVLPDARSAPGGSFAIDYTGMVMRHAPYPQEQVLAAMIDIEALREHRSRCNHNCWVDVRTEGFRQIYEKPIYPPNQFPVGRPPRTLADKMGPLKQVFREPLRSRSVHAAGRQDRRRHGQAARAARPQRPGTRYAQEGRLRAAR